MRSTPPHELRYPLNIGDIMPITIHNNQYVTVAERVKEIHEKLKTFDITTEVLSVDPVVIKATVKTEKGTFNGISAANPTKVIEKMSPYEVAETSAIGRALGFAGFGVVDSIATADEMVKAGGNNAPQTIVEPNEVCKKCGAPMKTSKTGGKYCSAICWKEKTVTASDEDSIDDLGLDEAPFEG